MALPTPNLDDRRFQDLVDDAKRMVMRNCPEWTDHNVSDPGVTLIETFAFMTDQLLYRLNRVPDRLYIKFLELIGLRLLPPTPAIAPVTFWLSTPAQIEVPIPEGTEASTIRTENEDPIVFTTIEDLIIQPCELESVRTLARNADESKDHTDDLRLREPFPAFAERPRADDCLLIGLSDAVPNCAIRLEFDVQIEGVGVDPTNPPLIWEAWTGEDWEECEISTDETGGLNVLGALVLHIPTGHQPHIIEEHRSNWIRGRVTEPEKGFQQYSDPPVIHGLSVSTVGGTIDAIHAEKVSENLGESNGTPGQSFHVTRTPVLGGIAETHVEVSTDEGWEEWTVVQGFAESGTDDKHAVLDPTSGEVIFGPVIREMNGSFRQYGAIPPAEALIQVSYNVGGGKIGNLPRKSLRTLRSAIPFVAALENRLPAHGGQDGESLEEAIARAPIMLRTRSRAVTAEDYEAITREIAPEIARVRCLTAGESKTDAGSVRVLLVPAAAAPSGHIEFEDLIPNETSLQRIAERLEHVRLIGTRVVIEPPLYRGVTVIARLVPRSRVSRARLHDEALEALYTFINPITGGPDGDGWPFGRPVQAGEVFSILQRVSGVDLVEDVRLFSANPVTGKRGGETLRLELEPNSLAFSYEHQIRIEEN